jgi:hypothetical protein
MLLGWTSCCARAMSDEHPKSMANRAAGPSMRMHVWKRPPLPNESPEPTNRTRTAMGYSSAADGTHGHTRRSTSETAPKSTMAISESKIIELNASSVFQYEVADRIT